MVYVCNNKIGILELKNLKEIFGFTVKDIVKHRFTDDYYYENSEDETDDISNYELLDMHFSYVVAMDDMFFISTSIGWIIKVRVTDFKIEFIK